VKSLLNPGPLVSDFAELFLSQRPLLDVRAPVEFAEGAFPHTTNLPLLTDDERHQVGLRYKQQGQDAAIALGYQLVDAQSKTQRIERWTAWAHANPDGLLYCFRGGLRSRLTQHMLADEAGIVVPRIAGGYKALRRFLLDALSTLATQQAAQQNILILGGRTGSGKTDLLQTLPNALDLEGIAQHRGSSFGRHAHAQPTQINIDNNLAIALLKHQQTHNSAKLILEDEGRTIGSRALPIPLYQAMQQADMIVLETPLEERVEQSFNDYVLSSLAEYRQLYGDEAGLSHYAIQVRASLERIQRRLGGLRHQQLKTLLDDGLQALNQGDAQALRPFIRRLLVEYYDPMYDYQINHKQARILFRGERAAIIDWLQQHEITLT
jgi:tRNA 2-selenouridine synthase